MWKYVLKRLAISALTILVILFILFLLLEFMPGTPFDEEAGKITQEQIAVLNEKYGLNRSVPERFLLYVRNMFTGDFGVSYVIQNNMPIADMLKGRVLISMRIGLQAMLVGCFFGLLLGIVAALNHNRPIDTVASLVSMIGVSIPSYVLALGLSYLLAFKLNLFPLLYSSKQEFISTILPTIALGFSPIATIARFSRTEMIEILNSDYIQLSEAKGIGRTMTVIRHALRNAMIPILTIMGPLLASLLTGSTVVETIFSVPGVGSLFVTALQDNDYSVSVTLAFLFSTVYIVIMLVVDIMYGIIDPRVRVAGGKRNGK